MAGLGGHSRKMVERSPEKAGVGGSIPSLATTLLTAYSASTRDFIQNSGTLGGWWRAKARHSIFFRYSKPTDQWLIAKQTDETCLATSIFLSSILLDGSSFQNRITPPS